MEKFFPKQVEENNDLDNVQKILTIINAASFLAASGLAEKAGPAAHQRIERLMQDISVWVRRNGGVPQDNAAVLLGIEAIEKMYRQLGPQIVLSKGH
jgi:hypothetical protein